MTQSPKRWEIIPRAPADHFARFPNIPPLIVQILYNRGITDPADAHRFLSHSWPDDDPFQLKGMRETVQRIRQAIQAQEPIAIYGDYDVDGVTATALMMHLLTALGANVTPYIPNRFDEGYGLNKEALTELAERGIKLVITVDCGIRSVDEVTHGNQLGLDLILTDHHSLGPQIPPAHAVINPKQPDCSYSFIELAGVGLAYKVAQALLQTDLPNSQRINAADFLDLVALGTIADLAPLHGENRKLAAAGLDLLNRNLRPGLQALLSQSKSNASNQSTTISAGIIGFVIGPRLNAAGRLDSALAAYNLLMAQTEFEAIHLAEQLDLQNKERQRLTTEAVMIARQAVLADEARSPLYFVSHTDFNPGVVGLAASRLTEEFYRPTLIAEKGPTATKGSARSIAEFHITDALDQCADLLERYGGHAAAAGFTVLNENVPALSARLQQIAAQHLQPENLRPTLTIDGEVNLRGVKPDLVEAILDLQPFGIGNRTPRFVTRGLKVKRCRTMGQDGYHLRLNLHDGRQDWQAVAFQQGAWAEKLRPGCDIDVVYSLDFNEWQGMRRIQLKVDDLRLS